MWTIFKLPLLAGLLLYFSPEDPCTHKARNSALGQAGTQLLQALALTEAQKNKIFEIQSDLFQTTETPIQEVELTRQKVFDGFLTAVEDERIDRDEIKKLRNLQTNQREARMVVIKAYRQALLAILANLNQKQVGLLDRFVPEIVLWEEAIDQANDLLAAFQRFKESYKSGKQTMAEDFEAFTAKLEKARPLVYIPPWIDLQLDAIANDLNMYRKEIKSARKHFAPVNEEDLTEADLVLDNAVALLAHALEMTRSPGTEEGNPKKDDLPFLSEFHRTLLVTPLFHCLLASEY